MNVNNVNLETFRPPLSLLLVALLVAFLSLLCTSNSKAQITVYQTVADGNWQTPGTWLNGIKPKLNNPIGDNIQIIINHKVSLQGKKVELDGNAQTLLEINNGSLGANGSGIKELIISRGVFRAINSVVEFESAEVYDKFEMTNSCFDLFNGNFKVDGGKLTLTNANIDVDNGNFELQGGGIINGNFSALNVTNGNISNSSSTWNATVDNYYASGNVGIPNAQQGLVQTPAWMTTHFSSTCVVGTSGPIVSARDGLWSDPSTWTGGIPGPDDDVLIQHTVDLDLMFTQSNVGKLAVDPSALLNVRVGSTLGLNGSLDNNGTIMGKTQLLGQSRTINLGIADNIAIDLSGTLTLSGSAQINSVIYLQSGTLNTGGNSFYLKSDANGTAMINSNGGGLLVGDITMEAYIDNTYGYHFLSSPMTNATVEQFNDDFTLNLSGANPHVYTYDESNTSSNISDGWIAAQSVLDLMTVGKGYACLFDATNGRTIDIEGQPNDGPISIPLTYTASVPIDNSVYAPQGWNFIGNPYPSSIDFNTLIASAPASVENALYRWDPTGVYNSYVDGVASPANFNTVIPAMQGFWVRTDASATLNLDNSIRITNPNSATGTLYKTNSSSNEPLFRLELEGEGKKVETVIRFKDQASTNFDKAYDAYFMRGDIAGEAEFATASDRGGLRINSLPELNGQAVEIQLHQVTNTAGNYQISLSEFTNFNSNDRIILRDSLTGLSTLLNNGPYSFVGNPGDITDRFKITVIADVNSTENIAEIQATFSAYKSKDALIIEMQDPLEQNQQLIVYNSLGQVAYQQLLKAGQDSYILYPNELNTSNIYFIDISSEPKGFKIKW